MPSTYTIPIVDAVILFPILGALIFVPLCVVHYRRFGQVRPWRALVFYAFAFYLLCAFFLTLLPLPEITPGFCDGREAARKGQLVPFRSVTPIFATGHSWTPAGMLGNGALLQVFFNFLLLFPLGVFLRYLYGFSLGRTVLAGFLVSLLFELTQWTAVYGLYPCPFRVFDVDDLWINTAGAAAGWFARPLFFFLPSLDGDRTGAHHRHHSFLPFRRAVSFVIDWSLSSFLAALSAGLLPAGATLPMRTALIAAVFVAVPIQLGGATPGQWLCRCRSESLTGEPATLGQLLLRVGCFFLLPFAVATLGAWLCRPDPDGFVNGWSAITSLALQFSTFLLFAIPMLFRKDHRGPHEWLSGTRTVITG